MGQDNSLLRKTLEDAHLTTETEAEDFWQKSLGKNAKAKGVRKQYIRDSAETSVNTTVIFYETMSGARMGDNPFGVFEYLRSHPEDYGEFLHVWSIDVRGEIPEQYANASDVVFARRNTRSYTYFLASAGYVVCNANLPGFFTRRGEQKYLNTWHGVPYKALGRDTPMARFGSPAGNGTFTKATHILTPCEFTSEKIASAYSMRGVSNATIAEIGYPRVDRTVNPDTSRISKLREQLGLRSAEASSDYRPTVLFAPTWRSENDKDVVDTDQLMGDLEALARLDVQLMYRGHHRMDRLIKDVFVGDQIGKIIIPSHEISSNDLLAVVDILITDFSSIFFDFLPTGRPVVHYLYDLDEYKRTRGLNLDTEELPGAVALTRSELVASVGAVAAVLKRDGADRDFSSKPFQGDRYKTAQQRFCPHEDGYASKRAVEFLIEDKTDGYRTRTTRDSRPTAAFWAGALKPGPTSEDFFRVLFKSASSPLEQTVLVVERQSPIGKEVLKKIKRYSSAISTFSYEFQVPMLLSGEEAAYNEFSTQYYLDSIAVRSLLRKSSTLRQIFSREYRRRLDDAQFDRVFLAADLTNEELALANFASQRCAVTANQWSAPSGHKLRTTENVVVRILPEGTTRRRLATWSYRKFREIFDRSNP